MSIKSKFKRRLKTSARGSETSVTVASDMDNSIASNDDLVIIDSEGQEFELSVKGVWTKTVNANDVIGFDAKQDVLISGTNIKTLGGSSILGSGDIEMTNSNVLSAPTVSGSNVIANGYRNINITFSATSLLVDVTVYSFSIDYKDGSAIETVLASSGSGSASHTFPTDAVDGTTTTIEVSATDSAGNIGAASVYTLTYIDNTPPTGTITSDAPSVFYYGTPESVTFTGATDSDGTVVSYKVSNISNPNVTVSSSVVSAGSAHTFTVAQAIVTPGDPDVAFTYTVSAIDNLGTEGASLVVNALAGIVVDGESVYTTPGTYSWVAPAGVIEVSAVCVGGGGHGAGNNNNPHNTESEDSYFINNTVVAGLRGHYASGSPNDGNSLGGSFIGGGGGSGGQSGTSNSGLGGGGAGGYAGNGGAGGNGTSGATNVPYGISDGANGAGGAGGGGGGGSYYYHAHNGGGGVGLFGQGVNGTGGSKQSVGSMAGGGSGGGSAFPPPDESQSSGNPNGTGGFGGLYGGAGGNTLSSGLGGGGGGLGWKNNIAVVPGQSYSIVVGNGGDNDDGGNQEGGVGGHGAVRIMWGFGRSFPTNAA